MKYPFYYFLVAYEEKKKVATEIGKDFQKILNQLRKVGQIEGLSANKSMGIPILSSTCVFGYVVAKVYANFKGEMSSH